jgi:hypothetical protein
MPSLKYQNPAPSKGSGRHPAAPFQLGRNPQDRRVCSLSWGARTSRPVPMFRQLDQIFGRDAAAAAPAAKQRPVRYFLTLPESAVVTSLVSYLCARKGNVRVILYRARAIQYDADAIARIALAYDGIIKAVSVTGIERPESMTVAVGVESGGIDRRDLSLCLPPLLKSSRVNRGGFEPLISASTTREDFGRRPLLGFRDCQGRRRIVHRRQYHHGARMPRKPRASAHVARCCFAGDITAASTLHFRPF